LLENFLALGGIAGLVVAALLGTLSPKREGRAKNAEAVAR
jgi:hypothetical protein